MPFFINFFIIIIIAIIWYFNSLDKQAHPPPPPNRKKKWGRRRWNWCDRWAKLGPAVHHQREASQVGGTVLISVPIRVKAVCEKEREEEEEEKAVFDSMTAFLWLKNNLRI